MPHRPEEQPDDVQELRKRLERLERRADAQNAVARRSWQASAGLAAGVAALVLSLSLPWMRGGKGDSYSLGASFSLDPEMPLRLGDPRSFVTGWQMWGASFFDQRMVVFAFLALAVLAGLAVASFITTERWVFTATQIAAFPPPLLFLVSWPGDPGSSVGAGPGPTVAVLACLVIGLAADRGKPEL